MVLTEKSEENMPLEPVYNNIALEKVVKLFC